MTFVKQLSLLILMGSFIHAAQAASPGGANAPYGIQTDTLDSGGQASASEPYCNHGTIGGIHGATFNAPYSVTHGYLSQVQEFSGPILDLNGPDGGGVNFSGTLVEDGVAVTATDSDMTIDDLGAGTLDSAVVKIANLLDGAKETLTANTGATGIVANYNTGTGVLTLTGNSATSNYVQVFKTIVYNNSSQKPTETLRKIRFQVNGISRDACSATCSVTVVSVNDQPTFTKGPDQAVKDVDGGKTLSWASGIAPGPVEEAGEGIVFTTTNNNNSIFSIQPAVATDGTLTYAPLKFASGLATVTVTLKDTGGTANGGVDTNTQTFTINVSTDSTTYLVNTPSDAPVAGKVSLREALNQALAGDRIIFDPGVFAVNNPTDQNKIKPATQLPTLDDGNVLVDASNVKVIIDGSVITGEGCGLLVTSSNNTIQGFTILDFAEAGLCVRGGAQNNTIGGDRNVGGGDNGQGLRISRNGNIGLEISGAGTSDNTVKGCWIGVSASGDAAEANETGVVIKDGATGNTIGGGTTTGEVNVVSGNADEGIAVFGEGTNGNLIMGNLIGSGAGASIAKSGSRKLLNFIPIGNGKSGIGFSEGTKDNKVGGKNANEPNVIADNGKLASSTESGHGVSVREAGTQRNAVRNNAIFLNELGGIQNLRGGNNEIEPPKKTGAADKGVSPSDATKRSATISGTTTAGANSEVDLFNDDADQGEEYLGTATVLGDGSWATTVDLDPNKNLTATVTSVAGDTSVFANFGKALESSQDTDGDGFPDNIETAAGTDPNNAADTPFGGTAAPSLTPLSTVKLKLLVKLNFKLAGKDGIKLLAPIPVPAGFLPDGKQVIVNVGGVVRAYLLNSKGKSPKGNDFAKVAASKKVRDTGGIGKFQFTLKLGSLGSSFVEEGMSNTDTGKVGVNVLIPVRIYFENQVIGGDIASLYKAIQDKKGLAKSNK